MPPYLTVVRSEGFSAFGDCILTYPTADAVKSIASDNDSGGDAAIGGVSSVGRDTKNALLVRKFSNATEHLRDLATLSRLLALHVTIPDTEAIRLMPIVDAYVESSHRDNVYIVTPAFLTNAAEVLRGSVSLVSQQILFIAYEIALVVKYFHSKGIVLGEIRPEAIMIDPVALGTPGSVRFSDFSLCHLATEGLNAVIKPLDPTRDSDPQRRVQSRALCYRSPEWALELTETVGLASDMWALGCLLVELVTKKPLFSLRSGNDVREYAELLSGLLPFPDDSTYMTNAVARDFLKRTCEGRQPVGVASIASGGTDPMTRQIFLLVKRMIAVDPSKRVTIEEFLHHPLMQQTALVFGAQPAVGPSTTTVGASPGKGVKVGNNDDQPGTSQASVPSQLTVTTSWAVCPTDRQALMCSLYENARVL